MNFQPFSREYQRLEQAGWKPIAIEPDWKIDQIWVRESRRWNKTDWFQRLPTPTNISDHNPIGAELYTHSPAVAVPTLLPTVPVPTTLTPPFGSSALTGARILRRDEFDDACVFSQWTSRWKTERFSSGILEIVGEEPWQAFASRYKEFAAGQGILLRFQFTPGSEFEFRLDTSTRNSEGYRRFGINVFNSRARAIVWQGSAAMRSERLSDDPEFASNLWHTLLLALGKGGEFVAQIWDATDPAGVVRYKGWLDHQSSALPWTLQIGAKEGKIMIDSLTEISFDGIK